MSKAKNTIGSVASIQSGFAFPSSEFTDVGVPVVRMSDLKKGRLNFKDAKFVASSWLNLTAEFELNEGDFLLGMSGSLTNHAKVTLDDLPALLNQRVARLRPSKKASYEYLCYWLTSEYYYRYAEIQGEGAAQKNISSKQIENFEVLLPSIGQQQKIATILSTIDTAIEKTETLIAKYQQIKAGLMHDLFTRGVLPNGQLRPSREQAPELYQETTIGWIPKDWGVELLGSMADIVSGITLGSKNSTERNIEVPYLRVANVQDGYLDLSEIKTVMASRSILETLRLKQGDVLMNEGGDFDKLGRGTVWECEIDDCIHQNHVFRVRTQPNLLSPYFLAYFSESYQGKRYFLISSKQSTNLASINSTQLHKYPIALPDMGEQIRIQGRLKAVKGKLNKLSQDRDKIKSQKLGLMQDLLTGKVSVSVQEPELAHE